MTVHLSLPEYEDYIGKTVDQRNTIRTVNRLIEEAREAGDAAVDYVKDPSTDTREALLLELGDVVAFVTRLSQLIGGSLNEVIDANHEKLVNRDLYGKGGKGKRS